MFKNKYLKYKQKYLDLKNQIGGALKSGGGGGGGGGSTINNSPGDKPKIICPRCENPTFIESIQNQLRTEQFKNNKRIVCSNSNCNHLFDDAVVMPCIADDAETRDLYFEARREVVKEKEENITKTEIDKKRRDYASEINKLTTKAEEARQAEARRARQAEEAKQAELARLETLKKELETARKELKTIEEAEEAIQAELARREAELARLEEARREARREAEEARQADARREAEEARREAARREAIRRADPVRQAEEAREARRQAAERRPEARPAEPRPAAGIQAAERRPEARPAEPRQAGIQAARQAEQARQTELHRQYLATLTHEEATRFNQEGAFLYNNVGNNVDGRDKINITPLIFCTQRGSIEMMRRILLERGGNVNLQDNTGWTALHYAVNNNDIEKVKLLVSCGAIVNIMNKEGKTPLTMARSLVVSEILQYGVQA